MAVAEGTGNLPQDAGGRYYAGLYCETDGDFYSPRAPSVVTILASAARTATPTINGGSPYYNRGYRGIVVVIYTSAASSPSTTVTLYGYDPVSAQTWPILASAAITGTGTTTLKVYPALTASANAAANDVLPPQWKIGSSHGNANSHTYSIAAQLLI